MPPSSRHVSQPIGTSLPPATAPAATADNLSVVLATGGYDNTIRFWEAWSGMCSRVINHSGSQVNKLAISPDKRFLAAAGNPSIRIFDVATAGLGGSAHHSPVATFEGHTGNVTCLIWNGDGKWVASGSEDGTIKVWDIRTGTAQRNYTHTASVNDLQLQSHQGELVSCDQSGAVKIWDLSSSVCTHELMPEEGVPMRSISVACDSTLLVGGNNKGNVFVWSLLHSLSSTDLRPKYKFQAHQKYILKCSISPDTKYLATSSADATINIYNTGSDGPSAVFPPVKEKEKMMENVEFKFEKSLVGHQRWVWDLAWSADSAYLVSASSDHTARLWELSTGMTVRQYAGHHKPCVAVALNDISTEEEQVQMMNAVKM